MDGDSRRVARLPSLPAMLILTPGLRVVECGPDQVQVGLDPAVRVRLPADPSTLAALDDPAGGSPRVARLQASGCVVSEEELAARRRRRLDTRVAVLGELADEVRPLLAAVGLREVSEPEAATLVVVLVRGEVDRHLVSRLMRAEVPHLLCRLIDSVVLVGPFVSPGRTACLHCIDLHRTVEDPVHLAVGQRYTEALRESRSDGQPDPPDIVEAALGAALVVRDLLTWLDGGTPWTWSKELRVGAEESWSSARRWLRHPECGCAWQAPVDSSVTMET